MKWNIRWRFDLKENVINAIVETVGAFGEEKSVVTTLDNTSLEGSAEKVSYEMTVKVGKVKQAFVFTIQRT